jgi:hypothetical protein
MTRKACDSGKMMGTHAVTKHKALLTRTIGVVQFGKRSIEFLFQKFPTRLLLRIVARQRVHPPSHDSPYIGRGLSCRYTIAVAILL